MENKIAQLTDTLYKEGVEKGEKQAQEIISEARAQAQKTLDGAKEEARKIIDAAQEKAEELKRNVASEIKLSGQQALSTLKQQILDVVTAQTIDTGVSATLDDPAMVKEIILAVIDAWKAGSGESLSLEVLLPEEKKDQLQKTVVNSVQKALKGGVTVSFSRGIKGGFQLGPSDGSFKLGMTDEDFSEFFKEFARPKARAYLFGDEG